jgi:hypothetical protein
MYVSKNYNEGWNAFHAASLFSGENLYFPSSAVVTNNYPPLSFFIIAGIMHFIPDAVFAGRIVATLSFVGIAIAIGSISYLLNHDVVAAFIGSLLFVASIAVNYNYIVGSNDPQMLAHALILLGLYLCIRFLTTGKSPILAALLMCLGLFTKHSVIALPATLAIWFFLYDRNAFFWFTGCSALIAIGGLFGSWLTFGSDFITGLIAPRRFLPVEGYRSLLQWLPPMTPLLMLSVLPPLVAGRNLWSAFFVIYVVISVIVGCIEALGSGVGPNAIYDVVIACALATSYVIGRLSAARSYRIQRFRFWIICTWLLSAIFNSNLVGAKDVIFAMPSWIMVQRTEEFRMQKVVTMLASAPGPALCETPILCYWAGKKFEVDPFNFMEGVAAGIKNEDTVLERLRSSYYGIVQVFSPDTTSHFSPRFFSVLRSHYAPVASPLNSVELFVPR